MSDIKTKIKLLPNKPGVYIFKNIKGQIIYIGKANSLRKRVSSYFTRPPDSHKTALMLEKFHDLEYIITSSELEALMLESNFIKKEKPKYNILLRDDKNYPYIKISFNEKWPRVFLTRNVKNDGAKYFGPYSGATVKETLRQIKKIFPLRWCTKTPLKQRKQPCMYFHIKRCLGPCVGSIDNNSYLEICREVEKLITGKLDNIIKEMKRKMLQLSDDLRFEEARLFRDRISRLEQISSKQAVVSTDLIDRDVIVFSASGDVVAVVVFLVRSGKLIGREIFFPKETFGASNAALLNSILMQYYSDTSFIPPEIIIQESFKEKSMVEKLLSKKKGSRVKLIIPMSGNRKKLLEMGENNSREILIKRLMSKEGKIPIALAELQKKLSLSDIPFRIEAFDVSNTQGEESVGSMVTFEGGYAKKGDYRKFKIKSVFGPDDFSSIYEIVKRRYSKSLKNELNLPDLVLIDGGRGQINAAKKAMNESKLPDILVIGLAKKLEQVYLINRKSPLILKKSSPALHLLQRIRNEAHRFAITFHRSKRMKKMLGK